MCSQTYQTQDFHNGANHLHVPNTCSSSCICSSVASTQDTQEPSLTPHTWVNPHILTTAPLNYFSTTVLTVMAPVQPSSFSHSGFFASIHAVLPFLRSMLHVGSIISSPQFRSVLISSLLYIILWLPFILRLQPIFFMWHRQVFSSSPRMWVRWGQSLAKGSRRGGAESGEIKSSRLQD